MRVRVSSQEDGSVLVIGRLLSSSEEAAAVQARYGPRIAAASQRLARSLADCQADPDILRVMRIATE